MAKIDYPKAIRSLELSYDILPKKPEALSKSDLKTLGEACSLYLKFYEPFVGASIDPRIIDAHSFHKFVIGTEIENLINKFKEAEEAEKETKQKPKEQDASIPPELESLVAEYRQNQALLESEDVKSNSQRSVAEQVKIAIAHSKIKELALANSQNRVAKGEKFQNADYLLVSLGSPKSGSEKTALADSYYVAQKIAFTYGGFSKLSPELQNQIISSAVELNLVGVSDINTAIQASALQVDITNLSDSDRDNLATIPGGFVSTIYQEVVALDQQEIEYQAKIAANEERIIDLEKQGKIEETQLLAEENLHLLASIEGQSARFTDKATKLTESFKDFEKNRDAKYSQIEEADRDFRDKITSADDTITSIHNNLKTNGVKGHIYTAMDDAQLLEQAIRKDMPGFLRPNASYDAEYAAALINHPKTQDPNLSPQAILLYGKELTPTLLAKARRFALKNPDSALGKLLKTRREIFDSAGSQLRKIAASPLGKEIFKVSTGIGKVFRIVSNPISALKSWAGRKAGEQFIRILKNNVSQAVLNKIPNVLLQGGIAGVKTFAKEAITRLVVKGVTWAALKLGISLTAESLNAIAPGVGLLVDIALQVIIFVAEKTIGYAKKVFDNVSIALYGEKIKARDILAIPVAGVATAVGGVIAFFGALATATVAAAGSAVAITIAGTFIGVFFYITSIAVAPLLSTLVQLESTTHPGTGTVSCSQSQIIADRAGAIVDNLQSGFWGYYNKSPDYPGLFDDALFAQNPNLIGINTNSTFVNLFWCTWLVVKSFSESSSPILVPQLVTHNLTGYFQSEGRYLDANDITIQDVCPGMAVFFHIPAGSSSNAHVGIVYSVSSDGVTTVESNAPYKTMLYPTDGSGHFQIISSGSVTIEVSGFGTP